MNEGYAAVILALFGAILMFKVTCLTMFSALFVIPAAAQTAGIAATRAVVNACGSGDPACRGAMGNYMDTLQASSGRGEIFDQGIADLVVALADAASEDGKCNELDKQLGLAISQASAFAVNGAQRGQIEQIAQAVTACSEIQTASIMPISEGLTDEGGATGEAAAARQAASPN